MEISYIIPMYNAEEYIVECIQSILNQELDVFEIIVVDDGSTDCSLTIVKNNFESNCNVRIYHQKNAGVSAARNFGISKSKYEYITFVDADDTLEREAYSILNQNIVDCDLIISNFKIVNESNSNLIFKSKYNQGNYLIKDFTKEFFSFFDSRLVNSNCNKIYKKSIINKYNISFERRLKMGEDLSFNLDYLKHCTKISVINNKLYNYYLRKQQTTQQIHPDLYYDVKVYYQKMKSYFDYFQMFPLLEKSYYAHLYNEVMWAIINICRDNNSIKNKIYKIKEIYNDSFFIDILEKYSDNTLKYKLLKTRKPMLLLIPYIIKYGK